MRRHDLKYGDRVRLRRGCQAYHRAPAKNKDRLGTISVRSPLQSTGEYVSVLWDGRTAESQVLSSELEVVDTNGVLACKD